MTAAMLADVAATIPPEAVSTPLVVALLGCLVGAASWLGHEQLHDVHALRGITAPGAALRTSLGLLTWLGLAVFAGGMGQTFAVYMSELAR